MMKLPKLFKMRDDMNRESRTLAFVTMAFAVINAKFLVAGMDLSHIGLGVQPPISITDYAMAVTTILAVWVSREWVKKPTSFEANLPPGA